jgi:hypothetical protein
MAKLTTQMNTERKGIMLRVGDDISDALRVVTDNFDTSTNSFMNAVMEELVYSREAKLIITGEDKKRTFLDVPGVYEVLKEYNLKYINSLKEKFLNSYSFNEEGKLSFAAGRLALLHYVNKDLNCITSLELRPCLEEMLSSTNSPGKDRFIIEECLRDLLDEDGNCYLQKFKPQIKEVNAFYDEVNEEFEDEDENLSYRTFFYLRKVEVIYSTEYPPKDMELKFFNKKYNSEGDLIKDLVICIGVKENQIYLKNSME